jgi:two-component system cell cycle response regulator DivK
MTQHSMDGSTTPIPEEFYDNHKPFILYIEDDDHTFRLVSLSLGRFGYRVAQAETAAEGLRMARLERPDLILMDVWLPGEINGFAATEVIKNDPELSSIPVVVLTAQHAGNVQSRAAAVKCDAFLSKPVSVTKLTTCISGLLGRENLP